MIKAVRRRRLKQHSSLTLEPHSQPIVISSKKVTFCQSRFLDGAFSIQPSRKFSSLGFGHFIWKNLHRKAVPVSCHIGPKFSLFDNNLEKKTGKGLNTNINDGLCQWELKEGIRITLLKKRSWEPPLRTLEILHWMATMRWGDRGVANFQMRFVGYFQTKPVPMEREISSPGPREYFKSKLLFHYLCGKVIGI